MKSRPNTLDAQSQEKLLDIKAALLCAGLKSNEYSEYLARIFNPWSTKRTGHVGVHINLGNLFLNLPMDRVYNNLDIYTNHSPFELKPLSESNEHGKTWLLIKNGREVISSVNLILPPTWYGKKTTRDIPMPELFLSEGNSNLMGALPGPCYYGQEDTKCKYCGFGGRENLASTAQDYAETILTAFREDPAITVTLTGGNTSSSDRGLKRYLPYMHSIKSIFEGDHIVDIPPIQIECSPPKSLQVLKESINAGATSFSINLEIFNDEKRKQICPGKSQISREEYEASWRIITEELGPFRACSALIHGLEPSQSTIDGAEYLLKHKVRPDIIPFKPIPGSYYEKNEPSDYKDYREVTNEVAKMMNVFGVDVSIRMGCTTCGACTLQDDTSRYLATR